MYYIHVLYSWIIVGIGTVTNDVSTRLTSLSLDITILDLNHSVFRIHVLGGDKESKDTSGIIDIAYSSASIAQVDIPM